MTNNMIIMVEKMKLADAGILKYTGRIIKGINLIGEEVEMPEIEEINTFLGWRALGYDVKKGEKARAQFPIWYYRNTKKQEIDPDAGNKKGKARNDCYMRVASWFTADQVKKHEDR